MSGHKDIQAENRKVNRAAFNLSGNPDGQLVLDALRREFGGVRVKKSPQDGMVDPVALQIAVGSNLVIQTLEEWIENGKLAR